jgi:pyruvate formate lyase activating enzyme
MKAEGVWLELVYLMVPTLNDSEQEIEKLCGWVLANLGDQVPLHFTRFHPSYLMTNLPSTPIKSLEMAYHIARKAGLKYPYIGNVPGHAGEHTHCPECGKIVVQRRGFHILANNLDRGKCKFCDQEIAGVWS